MNASATLDRCFPVILFGCSTNKLRTHSLALNLSLSQRSGPNQACLNKAFKYCLSHSTMQSTVIRSVRCFSATVFHTVSWCKSTFMQLVKYGLNAVFFVALRLHKMRRGFLQIILLRAKSIPPLTVFSGANISTVECTVPSASLMDCQIYLQDPWRGWSV